MALAEDPDGIGAPLQVEADPPPAHARSQETAQRILDAIYELDGRGERAGAPS